MQSAIQYNRSGMSPDIIRARGPDVVVAVLAVIEPLLPEPPSIRSAVTGHVSRVCSSGLAPLGVVVLVRFGPVRAHGVGSAIGWLVAAQLSWGRDEGIRRCSSMKRSVACMTARRCRSGRWLVGSGCIAGMCERRWSRRCRHRSRPWFGRRRRWMSSRRSSTAGSKRIGRCHANNVHAARRVWQRLVDQHEADLGESTVRRYVKVVREREEMPLGEVAVPQHHPLGEEAQVDPRLPGRRAHRSNRTVRGGTCQGG